MNKQLPIGIFDSGLGGLTVLQQLKKQLPREKFIYFGDTANVPYGNKSPKVIIQYCLKIIKFFEQKGVKLIIVGCNTASSVALQTIKQHTTLPVLDVIKPCVEKAIEATNNNKIGIKGTQTTIQSKSYQKQITLLDSNIKVYTKACPLFVPIIEEGLFHHDIAHQIILLYLLKFTQNKHDTLILGCTHYPLLKQIISKHVKSSTIIDSSITTALHVSKYLQSYNLKVKRQTKKEDE